MKENPDLKGLYLQYRNWQIAFMNYCIQTTDVPLLREYYRGDLQRIFDFPNFCKEWLFEWSPQHRAALQRKWAAGFNAWIEHCRRLDEAFVTSCKQDGISVPEEIRKQIDRRWKELKGVDSD